MKEWDYAAFTWLAGRLEEINELMYLNCAMSDGGHLFTYHDSEGYNGMALPSGAPHFQPSD